jgi:hypothetical protein
MHMIEMEIDPEMNFFCPMTGKQVFGPDGFKPSKAMAFVYSPDASDFEMIRPWAKKIWDAIESKASEDDMHTELFERFLEKLQKHSNLVTFVFSAAGPWTVENYLCFDFAYGTEGAEEEQQDTAKPKARASKKPKARRKATNTKKKKR